MARTEDTHTIPEFSSPFMDDGKCWSCGGYGEHHEHCSCNLSDTEKDDFFGRINAIPGGCWDWLGAKQSAGYGTWRGRLAHRVSFEYAYGPIPEGGILDHLCRRPICVRPDHLEAVNHSINALRGDLANRRKTHCPRGHAYDAANTYRRPGLVGRSCLICITDRAREWKRRHRAEQAVLRADLQVIHGKTTFVRVQRGPRMKIHLASCRYAKFGFPWPWADEFADNLDALRQKLANDYPWHDFCGFCCPYATWERRVL